MSKGIGIFWGALVIAVVALGLLRIKPLVSGCGAAPAQISEQQQPDSLIQPGSVTHEPTILEATPSAEGNIGSPLASPLEGGFEGQVSDAPESPVRTSSGVEFLPIPNLDNRLQR